MWQHNITVTKGHDIIWRLLPFCHAILFMMLFLWRHAWRLVFVIMYFYDNFCTLHDSLLSSYNPRFFVVSEMVYVWNGVCFWNAVWRLERMNLIGAVPKLNNRSGFGLSTISLKLICWDGYRSQPPRNLFVEEAIVPGASPYPIIRDGQAPASTNHIPATSTVKRSIAVAVCVFLLEDVPVRCPTWLRRTI
jgi:hypothetical protein